MPGCAGRAAGEQHAGLQAGTATEHAHREVAPSISFALSTRMRAQPAPSCPRSLSLPGSSHQQAGRQGAWGQPQLGLHSSSQGGGRALGVRCRANSSCPPSSPAWACGPSCAPPRPTCTCSAALRAAAASSEGAGGRQAALRTDPCTSCTPIPPPHSALHSLQPTSLLSDQAQRRHGAVGVESGQVLLLLVCKGTAESGTHPRHAEPPLAVCLPPGSSICEHTPAACTHSPAQPCRRRQTAACCPVAGQWAAYRTCLACPT